MQHYIIIMLLTVLLVSSCGGAQKTRTPVEPVTYKMVRVPGAITYKKRELRAVWIASVANIDWPSAAGLTEEQQKREFLTILDDVKAWGMNAVIVQVRPTADTFYPSSYEPWSKFLMGTQGQAPNYNPLAFMVAEAHKRNLEFHAWFNPFRVRRFKENQLTPDHPALLHPDWIVDYNNQLYYNPGHPEARAFSLKVILEAVKHYDIDAVHMDDYFYPYTYKDAAGNTVPFPDRAEYERYGQREFATIEAWRRDNVNRFIAELAREIKKEKPYVKFGISPFGVWRNKAEDPTGSATTAGQTNYDNLFADTREWIKQGLLDYIAPQIYWNFGFEPAAYEVLLEWWKNEVQDHPECQLYIGHGAYKIGQKGWEDPQELPMQVRYNREFSGVAGSIYYSYKQLKADLLGISGLLSREINLYPALVPPMAHLDSQAPDRIDSLTVQTLKGTQDGIKSSGVRLTWQDADNNDSSYYGIYRLPAPDLPLHPEYLAATVRRTYGPVEAWEDFSLARGQSCYYTVTALDRLHNESPPVQPVKVTAGFWGIKVHSR